MHNFDNKKIVSAGFSPYVVSPVRTNPSIRYSIIEAISPSSENLGISDTIIESKIYVDTYTGFIIL